MPGFWKTTFPPPPTFTDQDVGDLSGKVFIVTGAASGVGFELAKIFYSKNGTVYIAARSTSRAEGAIERIRNDIPKSQGRLVPLVVDLADLNSIKPATEAFLRQESRLDVLVHNAGVMEPPAGSKTKMGHDLELGTHCLGPFVLTHLLEDILKKTASVSEPYAVRVVWVVTLFNVGVKPGAMEFDEQGAPKVLKNKFENYVQSKVGEAWLATKYAERLGANKILSVSLHPGLMRTELQRNMAPPVRLLMSTLMKGPVYGAYTELFASLSPSLDGRNNGGYIMAWGRVESLHPDILDGIKPTGSNGSLSKAQMLWNYTERETRAYI